MNNKNGLKNIRRTNNFEFTYKDRCKANNLLTT